MVDVDQVVLRGRDCCCDRCNDYNVACNECCKCVPKTICIDIDYESIHGKGTCDCDHRYVKAEYDCVNQRWSSEFPSCDGSDLGDILAWVTAGFSLDFDGVNQHLIPQTSPVVAGLDQFEIRFYFKTEAESGTIFHETSEAWISEPDSEASSVRIWLESGYLKSEIKNDFAEGASATSSSTVNDGSWHCVAVEFTHGAIVAGTYETKIFVDGSQLGSGSAGSFTDARSADLARIGCAWDHASQGNTDYFDGRLYMFAVYDIDGHDEVADRALFCSCERPESGLVALWKLHRGRLTTPIREHVADNHADMFNFDENSWANDRPNNCDECVFLLYSECFDFGVPLEEALEAPRADPNPNGSVQCNGWSYTEGNGPNFLGVEITCLDPSLDCVTADIIVGSDLYLKVPKDPEVDGCEYICGGDGCPCICQELCIDVSILTGVSETTTMSGIIGAYPNYPVCSNEDIRWAVELSGTSDLGNPKSITGNLVFRKAYTSEDCVLVLETDEYGNSSEVLQSCPALAGDFEFDDGTDAVTVSVRCFSCGKCESDVEAICCENALPQTLIATLVDGGDCPCFGNHFAPITYNSVSGKWTGTITTDADCGGGGSETTTINVEFYCDEDLEQTGNFPDNFRVKVETSCDSGGLPLDFPLTEEPSTAACDPPFWRFDEWIDCDCCDAVAAACNFSIEISE